MSSDLEKFLQQAAERLAQKTGGKQSSSGRPRPGGGSQRNQSVPPVAQPHAARRMPPVAEIIDAEVLDGDERRARALREEGPNPLSMIDTRPSLAQSIGQADERMIEHVQHVFGHELAHLAPSSQPLMGSRQANQTDTATEVVSRQRYQSPLVAMLRSPETLGAAFIVGEIFRRRIN